MKEKVKFQSGTHTVTVKVNKQLGKIAYLPGWGWYCVNKRNVAYAACGIRLSSK